MTSAYYTYYDFQGHKVDLEYLKNAPKADYFAGGGAINEALWNLKYYYGTMKDILEDISFFDEYLPGEFAINPLTGNKLKDDRGQNIRIQNGQLVDIARYPLIGSDSWPLYYSVEFNAYLTYSGVVMSFDNDILCEPGGFTAHSVIGNIERGLRLYFIYLSDGITLMPATGKTISTNPFKIEFYDLSGNKIDSNKIITPGVDEDDRQENWPEEFPEPGWVGALKDWFDGIGSGLSNFFGSIGDFFSKYGLWIIIGIAGFVLLIVLGMVTPVAGPVIQMAFKAVGKGIAAAFKAIGKGIAAIFKILFKGIALMFKGLFFLISWPFQKIAEKVSDGGTE